MDFLLDALTDWLKEMLVGGIMSNVQIGVANPLVKPSCLIVDEVGRCVYDRPCTDLFFDVVDRRYEKIGRASCRERVSSPV